MIHIQRRGLITEKNIKKQGGQSFIGGMLAVSQFLSKKIFQATFVSIVLFLFFTALPHPLPILAPLLWLGEGQIVAFAKCWAPASWHLDSLPKASGPIPLETVRFITVI